MRFAVLGPVQARLDGRPVELGPARRRATLAALVVDVDRVVPLDTLVERIWDGHAPANPVTTVHAYISRLRAALRGPDAGAVSPLLTEAPGYRLAVDPATVDAVAFEAAVTAADRHHRAGATARAAEEVTRAAELWRGDPYADIAAGFALAEAGRLRGLRGLLDEIRVEIALAEGRHAVLVDELRALVAADPLRERLQGALILALYRSGRQAEALAAYEQVRSLLAEELGADPGRDLQALHQQILRQDAALDPPAPVSVTTGGHPTPAAAARTDAAVPRLVGRASELARVQAAVDRAWSDPRPTVVAVVGEAGIGKTRLLDEVAATAGSDVVVAWGRSWEHEGSPPLWPWVQVLRTVAQGIGADATAAALAGRAAPVASLDPALLGEAGLGVVPTAGSMDQVEVRVFDAVAEFLRVVGRDRRLLVLLEDLHWADPASRRLVEYLVAHGEQRGVAIVLTVRSLADDGGPVGSELLAALARTGRTTRVDLAGLPATAVREYVADRTGTDLDDATADALAERTGGNPFFVGEIVRLLVTDGESDAAAVDAAETEVPDSVREVVLRRVKRMSPDEQAVLQAAAVVGRTFDLELLREASGLDEDAVDEAVDHATAIGMLSSEPGAPDRHRFFHALVQQSLLEDIGPARRRRLHSRIAAAMLARRGADGLRDAEQVVHHLAASGRPEDLVTAGAVCIEASDAAHRRGAFASSEAFLTQAIELAGRRHDPDADRAEMTARTRLASMYTMVHHANYPGYEAMRERLTELMRRVSTGPDVLSGLGDGFAAALYTCDFVGGSAIAEEMVARGNADGDDVMLLGGWFSRGLLRLFGGRPDDAVDALGEALTLVERVGTVPVGSTTVPVEGIGPWRLVAYALAGRWDEAGPGLAALPALRRVTEPAALAHVEGDLAVLACVRDDVAAAEAHAAASVDVADRAGLGTIQMYIGVCLAWARARAGTADVGAVRRAVDGLPDERFLVMRPFSRGLLADVLLRTGEPADVTEAEAELTAAITEAAASGHAMWLAELHRLRALAWSRLGRPVDARAERRQAIDVATAQSARELRRRAEALEV